MGRAGRKRKSGPRHPSGQLVRETPAARQVDDKIRCGRQPHRRMLKEEFRTDARAESPIGRLLLKGLLNRAGEADAGAISDAARDRYEAAQLFAQIVGAYRSMIETPRSTAGSGLRGLHCVPQSCAALARLQGWADADCACYRVKQRYDGCYEALNKKGRREQLAVNRAALHGEAPQDLVNLVDGLDILVRHLGLTPRRGPRHSRNAN